MNSERFESMALADANKECSKKKDLKRATCRACGQTVMLHCDDCRIQITGCFDTDVDRFGIEEAKKRKMVRQRHPSNAGDQLQGSKGQLWTPHHS